MKYIVVLGDGMADEPIDEIGGKTPLEYAKTPAMDSIAPKAELGLAHTIPEGMKPGSDTANLAVLGYDPKKYYTGRSPLEALSIGVPMKDTDIAIRCNIVTVSDDDLPYEKKTIIDHSSSEISTEDAAVLMEAVQKELNSDIYKFYLGTSYRHLTIWDKGQVVELTPPHDVLGRVIGEYLPADEKLREMMKKSYDILNNHPLNVERMKKVVTDAIEKLHIPYIDKEKQPSVLFKEFGDNSINFKFVCWVDVTKQVVTESMIMESIYNTLNENDIEMPFPKRDVYIKEMAK